MPFPVGAGNQKKMRGITVNKMPPCLECGCVCGVLGMDPNNRKVCMDCLKGLPCTDGCCLDRPTKGTRGK